MIASSKRCAIAIKFVFWFLFSCIWGQTECFGQPKECHGVWSAEGKIPFDLGRGTAVAIMAPRGVVSVIPTDSGLSYVGELGQVPLFGFFGNPPLTEIIWAPNSLAFIVNESDGGLVGTWSAHYFSIEHGQPVSHSLDAVVRKLVTQGLRCDAGETPNFGVAGWVNGGSSVLLIEEIPPHSSCRNMGAFIGVEVSVSSWTVSRRFSERALQKRWPNLLGCRLRRYAK